MACIKIADGAVVTLAEVHDDVFLVRRHGGAVKATFVHLVEILYFEFDVLATIRNNRETFFAFSPSSLDKNTSVG